MIRPGMMRVQLVRKLADYLDGIDVSEYEQGDIIDLPWREAELLITERWAAPYAGPLTSKSDLALTTADELLEADRIERRTLEQLRRARAAMDTKLVDLYERRRAEDRIREELRDGRAKTINNGEPQVDSTGRTNFDAHSRRSQLQR